MIGAGDRIGCLTVLEVLEAAQARERDLRGYYGKQTSANGSRALVRCDCLLEFTARARELSRRRKATRCGSRCEVGVDEREERRAREWTHCRNPLCGKELNAGGMGRPNRTGFCNPCKATKGVRRWYELTRPDHAKKVARRIAHDKQVKERRKANGQCIQCGIPSGDRLCDEHRLACNEAHRRCRARCVRGGICISCKRLAVPGRARCRLHLDMNAKLSAELYRRRMGLAPAAEQRSAA